MLAPNVAHRRTGAQRGVSPCWRKIWAFAIQAPNMGHRRTSAQRGALPYRNPYGASLYSRPVGYPTPVGDHLHKAFGEIHGLVLSMIDSFIHMQTQMVIFNGRKFIQTVLDCSVSQGSISPVLFLLHTADITNIALRHGFSVLSFVNDTQL